MKIVNRIVNVCQWLQTVSMVCSKVIDCQCLSVMKPIALKSHIIGSIIRFHLSVCQCLSVENEIGVTDPQVRCNVYNVSLSVSVSCGNMWG
jgi:hypothetical protein